MQMTLRQVEKLERQASSARNQVKRIKAEAQEIVSTIAQTAEIGASAFGFGVINGYWSSPEVIGIPVDLGAAAALHLVGFLLDDGAEHVHNLGDGALASYLTSLGVGIGRKMLTERQAQQLPAAPAA